MIDLYGSPYTAGTFVHAALETAGTPHRRIEVTRNEDGTLDPPGYAELNPSATVPTLVDSDLVLFETVAILEHLVETQPGLGPRAGEPGRPQLHFWLAWLTNNPMAAFYRWFKADDMIAAEHADALRAGAVASLAGHGAFVEARLAGRDWLVGDAPTVADIFLQGLGTWADEIEGLALGGAAVAAHAARTAALPGVARAVAQESAGTLD